jgi:hypothetical protein
MTTWGDSILGGVGGASPHNLADRQIPSNRPGFHLKVHTGPSQAFQRVPSDEQAHFRRTHPAQRDDSLGSNKHIQFRARQRSQATTLQLDLSILSARAFLYSIFLRELSLFFFCTQKSIVKRKDGEVECSTKPPLDLKRGDHARTRRG